MPLLSDNFQPQGSFKNAHLATIYPYFLRRFPAPDYQRERLELPDGDFIDLDFRSSVSDTAVLITHGLEGSAHSKYVLGMGRALHAAGWSVVALNLRGCSGEPNRLPISYHSGKTDDLHTVIEHLLDSQKYKRLFLVGFSLGGNLTLRYMGEFAGKMPDAVKAAVAISAPCDLYASVRYIKKSPVYLKWLLAKLKRKARQRLKELPEGSLPLTEKDLRQVRTFEDFDGLYTAPIHGFSSANDYYAKASSRPLLTSLDRPALLINALDDPFLGEGCYPYREAKESPFFHFIPSRYGGHVGFADRFKLPLTFWHEETTRNFLATFASPD